jgi:uncharacterized membrane protein
VAVFLGTLSKGGTQTLAFAYALAVLITVHDIDVRRLFNRFLIGSSVFFITYFGIRIPDAITTNASMSDLFTSVSRFNENINNLGSDGISLIIALLLLAIIHLTVPYKPDAQYSSGINPKHWFRNNSHELSTILVFYIVSTPFIYFVITKGNWNEIRIFTPIFIVHSLLLMRIRHKHDDVSLSIDKTINQMRNMIKDLIR